MNRNVKILAVSLVALNLVVGPAFATATEPTILASSTAVEQSNGVQIYTVDQAGDLAIKENFDFKTSDVDRTKLSRQIDDTMNNINTITSRSDRTITDKKDAADPLVDSITQLQNSITSADEDLALKKATLRDTIKNLFVTIHKSELQLVNQNQQIQFDEKVIQANRAKVKLGLMSKYDLESSNNDNLKNIRSRDAMVISIDKLYGNLKNFMGLDQKVNIKLDYTFLNQTSLIMPDYDSGLTKMKDGNLKIISYANDLKRAKDVKTDMRDKYGATTGVNVDVSLDKAQLTYDNAIKTLPYTYETAYNDVKDAYQSYFQKQRELDIKKMDLKNGEVKIKIGRLSQLDYLKLQTQTKIMENDLELSRIAFISAVNTLNATINGTN